MRELGIGLLGFGTVGAGVVAGLRDNGDLLESRLGVRLRIRRIADLDLTSDRGVAVEPGLMTTDAEAVIRDPGTDVVVELIGGTGPARRLVELALGLGKPVVTANKALLAEHGRELFAAASRGGASMHFEGSVGGGIPIVRALRDGLIANRIVSICGILNGTCNYILTRMESEGLGFDDALREAQRQGYAEANPGLDIDGTDTAHKAVILASLAYGSHVPMEAVSVEGIRGLSATDIAYGADMGYRIKLLAVVRNRGEGLEAGVYPALVPAHHVLASVSGVFNAIMVDGDLTGRTLYYGRGAGRAPTASAVISDLADVAREAASGAQRRAHPEPAGESLRMRDRGDVETRYYLRLSLKDRPGVLGRFATALGNHGVSIASVLQKDVAAGGHAPVVAVTHAARERAFDAALAEIDAMDIVGSKTVRLRIVE